MRRIIWLFVGIVILFSVVFPLFTSFVPGTADGLAHKFRLVAFHEAIDDGFFRPRWVGNVALDFGAPIFLFNYFLPYYVVDIFYRTTGSINIATQIYQAITLIFSFGGMYILCKKLWGKLAGLVSATLYTLAPYHLMSVSLYEGWGEMGAFVFPPLLLYLIIQITYLLNSDFKSKFKNNTAKFLFCYLLFVICYLLFIFTHNVSVLMFTPVIFLLSFAITGKNRKALVIICIGFLTAGLISAFFSLPAIFLNHETAYSLLLDDAIKWREYFYKTFWLLVANTFRLLTQKQAKYLDFSLGLPILSIMVICFVTFIRKMIISRKKIFQPFKYFNNIKKKSNLTVLLAMVMFLSLFLVSPASSVLWDTKILNWIVYPFRFLFLLVFAACLLGGYFCRKNIFFSAILIFLAILSSRAYTKPYADIFPWDNSYFLQPQTISYSPGSKKNMAVGEFLPKWANMKFLIEEERKYIATKKLPPKFILAEGNGRITYNRVKSEQMKLELEMKKKDTLIINTLYFPNWEAKLDGEKIVLNNDPNGRMITEIPEGKHNLEMNFGYDQVEIWGMWLTVIGVVMLLAELLIIIRKNIYEYQK